MDFVITFPCLGSVSNFTIFRDILGRWQRLYFSFGYSDWIEKRRKASHGENMLCEELPKWLFKLLHACSINGGKFQV